MRDAKVDVELSNHPNDYGLQRVEQLRSRPDGVNPFVLGEPRAQRFMAVLDLMLRGGSPTPAGRSLVAWGSRGW
ncbi:hypothetical protein AB0D37_19170 [Streptomyces sp. NPDC048384]